MATRITQRLQFDIPYDIYLRIRRHPDFPGWRGRNEFYCQLLTDYINSPAFRLKEMERDLKQARRERDQKAREAKESAEAAMYWRERSETAGQGGQMEPPPWWALLVTKPAKPDEAAH